MVAVKVYVEGGGATRADQRLLKEGFGKLFAKVLGARAKPAVVLCGGRKQAFDEFQVALRRASTTGDLCVLLVDSEGAIAEGVSSWQHVAARQGDQWQRPDGVGDHQLHLMVQMMEAWLVSDPDALADYYGQGFRVKTLPTRRNVEEIPKSELTTALVDATRGVKAKGKNQYLKRHGFELIALVDPAKIESRAARASLFFGFLRDTLPPR